MALTKLITCWAPIEAEIVKGALESAGIPCILQGAGISSAYIGEGLANSAFSVQVLVREEDLEDAMKVIQENAKE